MIRFFVKWHAPEIRLRPGKSSLLRNVFKNLGVSLLASDGWWWSPLAARLAF
ncbi:MAG: hypothetical protein ACI85K_000892 [Hyphomicrobiaceae bacterium]|jgi:hypothetical protein